MFLFNEAAKAKTSTTPKTKPFSVQQLIWDILLHFHNSKEMKWDQGLRVTVWSRDIFIVQISCGEEAFWCTCSKDSKVGGGIMKSSLNASERSAYQWLSLNRSSKYRYISAKWHRWRLQPCLPSNYQSCKQFYEWHFGLDPASCLSF